MSETKYPKLEAWKTATNEFGESTELKTLLKDPSARDRIVGLAKTMSALIRKVFTENATLPPPTGPSDPLALLDFYLAKNLLVAYCDGDRGRRGLAGRRDGCLVYDLSKPITTPEVLADLAIFVYTDNWIPEYHHEIPTVANSWIFFVDPELAKKDLAKQPDSDDDAHGWREVMRDYGKILKVLRTTEVDTVFGHKISLQRDSNQNWVLCWRAQVTKDGVKQPDKLLPYPMELEDFLNWVDNMPDEEYNTLCARALDSEEKKNDRPNRSE